MTLKTQVLGTTLFTFALTGAALWANGILPSAAATATTSPGMCLDTPAPPTTKPALALSTPVETEPSCGAPTVTPARTP